MSLLILDILISYMKYSFNVALVSAVQFVVNHFGSLILFSAKSFSNVVGVKFVWERSGEGIYALETHQSSIFWWSSVFLTAFYIKTSVAMAFQLLSTIRSQTPYLLVKSR